MLLISAILACAPVTSDDSVPPEQDSEASDDSQADSEDTDSDVGNPDAPVIQTCDAYCWLHTTGEERYEWLLECDVTDPQGLEDVWNGRFEALFKGNVIMEELVACDAQGYCSSAFSEVTADVRCEQASDYSFRVFVSDWSGNESQPFEVVGRKQ
jgi:hypothetical protein